LLALIFAAALYSLVFVFPQFYQSASSGITYLFGGGVLSTVQEAVPLFINPATGFTLDYTWYAFTFSFFIALIAFIYFIKKTAREKYPSEAVFLIVWTLIVLTLTILQRRFIYLLAVNIAIFSAYFIFEVSKLFSPEKKTSVSKKKQKRQRPSEPVSSNRPIIALILVALLAISNITVIKSMATLNAPAPDPDLQESFKWLKDNSPQTSYYENPDKPAEYGVMSWWDYGNWILYFSERPVVANNFQTGIEDAAHFLIEPDENAANEILNKRDVRFVITDAQMLKLKFKSIAMMAGRNPDDYYGIKNSSEEGQIRSVNGENRNFFATMLSRLHVFDGDGLSHYRLVYESKTTAIKSPDIKYVKIFEYVPGATLSGKTSADGDVKVTLNIVTNQGRTFVYTQQTKANNGRYEIRVPYSTQGNKYGIKPTSDYIIQNANTSRAVSVSEEDVMEGKVLQVDLI
jgi:dolichyl-diphosphooligosaccharide--protein glycosyltransferase